MRPHPRERFRNPASAMRIRLKLVLAITVMVSAMVIVLSALYLSQLLSERIQQSYRHTDIAAHQLLLAAQRARSSMDTAHVRVASQRSGRIRMTAVDRALQQDAALQLMLTSFIRYEPTIYDINIADSDGKILLSTDPLSQGHAMPHQPSFVSLQQQTAWQKFRIVFGPPAVYAVDAGLDRKHAPFLTVRVGVRTTFLRSQLAPWLRAEFVIVVLSVLLTIVLAALLSNMALHPLQVISDRLDQFMLAEPQPVSESGTVVGEIGRNLSRFQQN